MRLRESRKTYSRVGMNHMALLAQVVKGSATFSSRFHCHYLTSLQLREVLSTYWYQSLLALKAT